MDTLTLPDTVMAAEDLSVWFRKKKVLEGINIEFPRNTVTALIGPSGCGKSTFIRTLNRLHEMIPGAALAGQVTIDGQDIYARDVDPVRVRQRVGMVFQKPNPFPSMSIRENVLSGFRLSGTKKPSNDEEIVEESLRLAGLWDEVKDRLKHGAGELSGGQQQRLVVARAIAVRPEVLLMDEPASALDPGSTLRLEKSIRELTKTTTIIIVTHNMQQARRISENTAFFLSLNGEPGHIVEHGPTEEIFENPQDKQTQDYVAGLFG